MTTSLEKQVFENQSESIGHLNPGLKPIFLCIGKADHFKGDNSGFSQIDLLKDRQPYDNVDIYRNPLDLQSLNSDDISMARTAKESGIYIISRISEKNKYSVDFSSCTSLVVVGEDKETGKTVSFITHQDPKYVLKRGDYHQSFEHSLKETIEEMKNRCVPGTIDAVIVGGYYPNTANISTKRYPEGELRDLYREDYTNSIKLLSQTTKVILGFDPIVAAGPKVENSLHTDNLFVETGERRVYLVRQNSQFDTLENNPSNRSFMPQDVKDVVKKLEKD